MKRGSLISFTNLRFSKMFCQFRFEILKAGTLKKLLRFYELKTQGILPETSLVFFGRKRNKKFLTFIQNS
ncbi:hypothetical protein CH380_07710 [Leptospira adleri]|uniref:Uncharacterized protein n=1 Tax=Leptospira adleri TaxID=2023186 RepID=A0A2M9YQV7_9LEPT|nr:hypothetical protein CH380_07710 [Leptospira adleri]PJZ63103.1 hypothetical protein CH376_04420 [Leptospira adleri]